MRAALACVWVLFAVSEVGMTVWFHSARFLAIGAAALVMVAYNLRSLRELNPPALTPVLELAQPSRP